MYKQYLNHEVKIIIKGGYTVIGILNKVTEKHLGIAPTNNSKGDLSIYTIVEIKNTRFVDILD
jgi:hypothetical protein